MLSRARTTIPGQRVQVASATNPGGEGNDWVMERWAPWLDDGYPNPAKPGEIIVYEVPNESSYSMNAKEMIDNVIKNRTPKTEDYQGWKNYETWAVALWFDNDEGLYDMRLETQQQFLDDAGGDKEEAGIQFADWIKDFVEENAPQLEGLYADLLQGAISDVYWYEIAKNWLDEE